MAIPYVSPMGESSKYPWNQPATSELGDLSESSNFSGPLAQQPTDVTRLEPWALNVTVFCPIPHFRPWPSWYKCKYNSNY